jgi:hypothetical protein
LAEDVRSVEAATRRAQELEEQILRFRRLPGVLGWLYSVVAVGMTATILYQVGWGRLGFLRLLPLFLGLTFLTVFYLFPAWKAWAFEDPAKPIAAWKKRAAVALAWLDVPLALVAA